jgi:hypothetical protein
MKTVIAVQPEVDAEPVRVIANNIRSISAAVKKMESSGLTRRGLCLLLADSPGLNFTQCWTVLEALSKLGSRFIVKEEKP